MRAGGPGRRECRTVRGCPDRCRIWRDHHRDRAIGRACRTRVADVFLRRGVSPAVPGQEPEWVLRARRDLGVLPHRAGRTAERPSRGVSYPTGVAVNSLTLHTQCYGSPSRAPLGRIVESWPAQMQMSTLWFVDQPVDSVDKPTLLWRASHHEKLRAPRVSCRSSDRNER